MFHKYIDIERLKPKYTEVFTKGEKIVITEKIDGSSASISYNPTTNKLEASSRRKLLDETNNLNGFYQFVESLDVAAISKEINTKYIIHGEWLLPHTVKYPESYYRHFYVFDVYNTGTEQYMPWSFVKELAAKLNLTLVPEFYVGDFESWEQIMALVGKTEFNASPCGEGVVVKSQSRLDNKYSGTPAYIKVVSEKFAEIHDTKKPVSLEKIKEREDAKNAVAAVATKRRCEKILQKLIEDNIIPENWDEHDMKTVSRHLPKMMWNDLIKEEPEIVEKIEGFGKIAAGLAMTYAKEILYERTKV